jgi:hypothetical protein
MLLQYRLPFVYTFRPAYLKYQKKKISLQELPETVITENPTGTG